ncbi:MAG TPA: hypothetical protein VMH02_01870 [Verrucomicrobiae bacterium]|nr:hypothetical protein [Verrucomicrobiae bacterium]
MFLSLVHLRDLRCGVCGTLLASAGARSFVVGGDGLPASFDQSDPPAELAAALLCPQGHEALLRVPGDVSAEESLATPDGAPVAADARLMKL